ncbi:polysaccharide deacetylase family protein [Psychrobacillus sp. OK032]|uniref:polysaccharide deacetylase family protein n=1 Tax=Psychrobacillus sp. OK032 TaxID=1884358 RepID=UPI0008D602C9|nr:polysaccharide deacetylase family protein [Psychrobacillus sp. OK032]SES01455.1 Peptidoglycan/xylan/chitin deacetylase, PgdA/CDA1 family [Psychrobacillus sp. OK032]
MSTHPRSKKRGRWIDITFIIIILALSSLMFFLLMLSNPAKKEKEVVSANLPTNSKEQINQSDSVYPGIRIITETSNDEKTPYAIQYPQSNVPEFNDIVKAYTNNMKTLYLNETDYLNESNIHRSGELNISFEVFQHTTGYYSFVIHSYMNKSGTNGLTETRTYRLHNQSGHMLTINDLLANNEKSLVKLATKVREYILSDNELMPYLLQEQLEEKTVPTWDNFSNFSLKKDTIEFYYDNYEIAAVAAGSKVVSIPLEDMNEIIADSFKLPKVAIQPPPTTSGKENEIPIGGIQTKDSVVNSLPKVVALTFDDGPTPESTTLILDTLKKYNAKATFFMLGSRVSFYPEIVKEMHEAGHELGNHTWNHLDLTKASSEKIALEINNTSDAIEQATGTKPTVFRPPYGAVNNSVRAQTSLPVVLWDVDTLDWKYRNANHLLTHVKKHVKGGSTILMHDIHMSTAEGLDAVLAYLQGEGYSFVTVSELNSDAN